MEVMEQRHQGRPTQAGTTRIVTFNVNGLRATLKRKFGTVRGLLEELGADIVCIQETKLRRSELERELAVVDGWDSFFACAQSARGYSGVATFVRTGLTLPHAAEEGFTGWCATPAAGQQGGGGGGSGAGASIHPALVEKFSVEELQGLDSEGRVVVTDHGAFVLFNIYGPALTSEEHLEERLAFKLRFYQALQCLWEDYLQQGRAVMAVGDFNICPAPIDRCDPDPNFYRSSRPDRLWLRALLRPTGAGASHAVHEEQAGQQPYTAQQPGAAGQGALAQGGATEHADRASGPAGAAAAAPPSDGMAALAAGRFVDAFRAFHPRRQRAYSCWSTATAARANNWGSRIDLVLTAGLPLGGPPGEGACPSDADWGCQQGQCCLSHCHQQQQYHHHHQQQQQQEEEGGPGPVFFASFNSHSLGASSGSSKCTLWLSGCDIMADMEGSDHAPVWVDVCHRGPFPCASTAPPSATRYLFSGKQLKLHSWLAGGRGGAAQQAQQQAQQEAQQSQQRTMEQQQAQQAGQGVGPSDSGLEQGWGGAVSGSQASGSAALPSALQGPQGLGAPSLWEGAGGGGCVGSGRGKASSTAAGKRGRAGDGGALASKKQASLRGFFLQAASSSGAGVGGSSSAGVSAPSSQQDPAGSASAAAADPGAPAGSSHAGWGAEGLAGAAGAVGGGAAGVAAGAVRLGQRAGTDACPSACGVGDLRFGAEGSQGAESGGGSGGWGAVSTAAAARDAWKRIQQQHMTVPKCYHGEPAALKRVNKSGPNKGRYFYVCTRPDGPKPHGQCNFFQWVKKQAGEDDKPGSGKGSGKRPREHS